MRETIFFLALASANSSISLRVVEPMLPRLATDFGISVSAAASVITAYGLAGAIGTLAYGPLGDRYGKLRMATISLFAAGLASLACALAQDIGSLAVLRFITALFASSSTSLGMAYIGDRVPIAERQPVIARFIGGTIIGQALGPVVGGVMTDLLGWRGTLTFLGTVFAVVSAILFLRTRTQWANERPVPSSGSPYTAHLRLLASSRVRYVLAVAFADTFLFFGAYSFLGPFLKLKFDLSLTLIGTILAGFGVGGVLYTLAVRPLLRAARTARSGDLGRRDLLHLLRDCDADVRLAGSDALHDRPGIFLLHAPQHGPDQGDRNGAAGTRRSRVVICRVLVFRTGHRRGGDGRRPRLRRLRACDHRVRLGFFLLGLWMRSNLHRLS